MTISKILISDIDQPLQDNNNITSIDLRNTSFMNNSCNAAFEYCANLTTIKNLPNNLWDMQSAFSRCAKLTTIPAIPNSVRDLGDTFSGCRALRTITIPTSITWNYHGTFSSCTNLSIPALSIDAKDCTMTFSHNSNLVTAPTIPESVSRMSYTFTSCENLTGNIYISSCDINGATGCFDGTRTKNVYIPFTSPCSDHLYCFEESEVWDHGCPDYIYTKTTSITKNTKLYDGSGTDITNRFNIVNVGSFAGKISFKITNSLMTGAKHLGQDASIVEYDQYSTGDLDYGSPTKTYNAFINAGYKTDGSVNGVYLKDITLPLDLTGWTYTKNSSNSTVVLNKYTGSSTTVSVPTLPNPLPKGSVSKVVLVYDDDNYPDPAGSFTNNKTITSVDLKYTNYIRNNMYGAFDDCDHLTTVRNMSNSITSLKYTFAGCYALTSVDYLSTSATTLDSTFAACNKMTSAPAIPTGVTNMNSTFYRCEKLTASPAIPATVTNMSYTFERCYALTAMPIIPNSVTNMHSTFLYCTNMKTFKNLSTSATDVSGVFWSCWNLVTSPNIPKSATRMEYTFYETRVLTGNIYILSENVTNAYKCFEFSDKTKNVYIPFTYTNGEYTKTYNSFIAAGYTTTGTVNKVYLKNWTPPA